MNAVGPLIHWEFFSWRAPGWTAEHHPALARLIRTVGRLTDWTDPGHPIAEDQPVACCRDPCDLSLADRLGKGRGLSSLVARGHRADPSDKPRCAREHASPTG